MLSLCGQNQCPSNITSRHDIPMALLQWDMDVIGPINPKAFNRHCFILVAIDYFTKWVEVASYANVTRLTIYKFIK